jgi:hypothetical protein
MYISSLVGPWVNTEVPNQEEVLFTGGSNEKWPNHKEGNNENRN